MQTAIHAALRRLETQHDIRILYAVESGSRAWGFASPDSDWDVRFLYVHRPAWYLRIEPGRDTLEAMLLDDLDLAGWELRKALRLFRKSNPSLLEWLESPITYLDDGQLAPALRQLRDRHFNPRPALHHYRNMAAGNVHKYLQAETVKTKKYFYALRPLLACRWIERHGTPAPVPFRTLVDETLPEPAVREAVEQLWREKQRGGEATLRPRVPVLDAFIEAQVAYFGQYAKSVEMPLIAPVEELDALFRATLERVW